MKNLSVRAKITLWFSLLMVVIVALTYVVILSVSDSIMQQSIRDNLTIVVEDNVDEVEFFTDLSDVENDHDEDLYIRYGSGYLEIDDDFLDRVNDVSTALYQADGTLLYGENPIAKDLSGLAFSDAVVQKQTVSGLVWYIFDRQLTQAGADGLWLRGVASIQSETAQLSSIVRLSLILTPLLLLLAIFGGYVIAGRTLRPIRHIAALATQIDQGRDLKKRIALGSGTDEVHQLAQSFDAMFERLDAAFEAEQQFTADASHELRTPMSVIMAQCEFSLDEQQSPEEYRNALRVIQRQGRRMTRLIEDLLAFTRLERKADSFALTRLDLSALSASACADLALLPERNITLQTDIERDIFVLGDHVLLTRLITNLLSNAYRYGKDDGQIIVSLHRGAGEAVLSVADDGPGIAAAEQEKIFHRFYQADSARASSGTGLGLAMVREIAALHGGEIALESAPGVGSTFSFHIKLC